jgi:hypothetical protein
MTGCFTYQGPNIREWHNQNMATEFPTEFPFSPYQTLPIDSTETMGNFHKRNGYSEIPNFRTLDTVHEPSFTTRRSQFWGCKHQTNEPLRPMAFNTDSAGQMIDQTEANSLNLYRSRPDEPHAQRHIDEERIPTATTLPTPALSFNENHAFDNSVRCRTCESVIGVHIVTTANSHSGDGPPIKGRGWSDSTKEHSSALPASHCYRR